MCFNAFYVKTWSLLYSLKFQEGRGHSPLAPPINLPLKYRIESESDDPDNPNHLCHIFAGRSGIICKINYPDMTRVMYLVNHVSITIMASNKHRSSEGKSGAESNNINFVKSPFL